MWIKAVVSLVSILVLVFEGYCFYGESKKQGWWWYKDYVKEEKEEKIKEVKKEEKREEKKEEEVKEAKKEEFKPLTEYSYEELLKMPVEQFQRLFNYYRDLAISDPSNETNVYYFLNLVDVARKKALIFMATTQNVLNKYPELDVRKDVPLIYPAIRVSMEMQREEERASLSQLRDEIGLVLFVKRGCPYCDVQKEIIKHYLAEGVPVKIVDIEVEKGAVSRFGIVSVPTLGLVVKRTGEFYPLGSGVIALSEIDARIARVLGIVRGEKDPSQSFLYQHQLGTSLDPKVPPPLFRKKMENKIRR
ncbi:MAG: conjugal transfer protein TraF [Candidatus Bathyarchaeia archaeon]